MSMIVAWLKYEPLMEVPAPCSWEDEGDDLPKLPEWTPLSPTPSIEDNTMETDASIVHRK